MKRIKFDKEAFRRGVDEVFMFTGLFRLMNTVWNRPKCRKCKDTGWISRETWIGPRGFRYQESLRLS